MKNLEILDTTKTILNKAGFQVSEKCVARKSCFDFAAQRKDQLLFIKGLVNIGNISRDETSEFRRISTCFSGKPLFIGDKTNLNPLDDDTVYMRYKVCAITPKTLGNIIFIKMLPLVQAGPGGCYVNVDGSIIRKKRQEIGLSVGKLAELMGVSRSTIYGYERGVSKASVSAAYKLAWILGVQVARPIDVFQRLSVNDGFLTVAMKRITRNRLLQTVLQKLTRFDFRVTPTFRAPFDFIAQLPRKQVNVIGGVIDREEPNITQRINEILSVSKVINAQPVLITDCQPNSNNIPLIHSKDFSQIKQPEELISRL